MIDLMSKGCGVIHFIGIGGIGMSAIAYVMHQNGFKVQGSDGKESSSTKRLATNNIRIFIGHDAQHVRNADAVVVSSAIVLDNVEVQEALRLGIPVLHRSEMLAEIMSFKNSIAVAGTHGKTTTTSLLASVCAHLSPTVVSGGVMSEYGSNALVGKSNLAIVEADESDGSFCALRPYISIVTNIDMDHVDYFSDFESLYSAFENFLRNTRFYGWNVLCAEDPNIRTLLKVDKYIDHVDGRNCSQKILQQCQRFQRRAITYGLCEDADVMVYDISYADGQSSFCVRVSERFCHSGVFCSSFSHLHEQKFVCNLLGEHNVLNAMAVIITSCLLGVPIVVIQKALSCFRGVKRRFCEIGMYRKTVVVDDYAHHPTEIRATLSSARLQADGQKMVTAVFQPHRYTRLQHFLYEFRDALKMADCVVILPIYSAGECANGVTHHDLYKLLLNDGVNALLAKSATDVKMIMDELPEGIAVFMGAGDVTQMAYECVA